MKMLKECCLTLFYIIALFQEVKLNMCPDDGLSILTPTDLQQISKFEHGSTKFLTVQCFINLKKSPDFDKVSTITLLQSSNKTKYDVVAYINDVSNEAQVIPKSVIGRGNISKKGQSFLKLDWLYPEPETVGTYRCDIEGELKSGTPENCSYIKEISATQIKKLVCYTSMLVDITPINPKFKNVTIVPGLTKTIQVKCSHDADVSTGWKSVNDITLSFIDNTGRQYTVAKIDKQYTNPYVGYKMNATAVGDISNSTRSYLTVTLSKLSYNDEGTYICYSGVTLKSGEDRWCWARLNIPAVPPSCDDVFKISTGIYLDYHMMTPASDIQPGDTKQLLVNCSLNVLRTLEVDNITTLTLLRSEVNSNEYKRVASINSTSRQVTHYDDVEAYPKGVISNISESYLSVLWEYPDLNMAGTYRCEISGTSANGTTKNYSVSKQISSIAKEKKCLSFPYVDVLPPNSIFVKPYIEPGFTKTLLVNCTSRPRLSKEFNYVKSIRINYENNEYNFKTLASLEAADESPAVYDTNYVLTSAAITNTGKSVLTLQLSNPDYKHAGKYICILEVMTQSLGAYICRNFVTILAVKSCYTSFRISPELFENGQKLQSLHIKPGKTSNLFLTCSIDVTNTAALDTIENLTLLRSKVNSSEPIQVASININSGTITISDEEAVGDAFISNTHKSHLYVQWEYPDHDMAGTYTCEANGMFEGKHKTCSISSNITATVLGPIQKERCFTKLSPEVVPQYAKSNKALIEPGFTKTLLIKCSMTVRKSKNYDSVKNLFIMKKESQETSRTVAFMERGFTHPWVFDNRFIATSANISNVYNSYMTLRLSDPEYRDAGDYLCIADVNLKSKRTRYCEDYVEIFAEQSCNTSLKISTEHVEENKVTQAPIDPVWTSKLQINCSINVKMSPVMKGLKALTLYHSETHKSGYQVVASIDLINSKIKFRDTEGVGDAFFSEFGESYLYVEWIYPNYEMAGSYKCEAFGSSRKIVQGKLYNETCSSSEEIYSRDVSLKSLAERLRRTLIEKKALNEKVNFLERTIQEFKDEIASGKKIEITTSTNLKKEKKESLSSLKSFYSSSNLHNGHRYYLAKSAALVLPQLAQEACAKFDGYLAEIGDKMEFNFVIEFLNTNNGTRYFNILISGSDEIDEGTFLYARNNKKVTYLPWGQDQPDGKEIQNCLYLQFESSEWGFFDNNCFMTSTNIKFSYLCEFEEK